MLPREHYALHGPDHLGDADLLTLVLGTGVVGRPAATVARDCLSTFGSLAALAEAPLAAVAAVPGVGPCRAIRVQAALQAGMRAVRRAVPAADGPVDTPAAALDRLRPRLEGLLHEELHALYLDRRSHVRAARRLTAGSDAATVVDVRQVLQPAIMLGACGIIVAHNHPSGDPRPSPQDIAVTRRLAEGAAALDLRLHDHLIIAGGRYTSFAEEDLLPRPGRAA